MARGVRVRGVPLHGLPAATAAELRLRAETAAAERRLQAGARAGRTIVIGPWLSEVGFEVLYWIPFVRAALSRLGAGPERVAAVSRGGAAPWYAGLARRYADAFDVLPLEDWHGLQRGRLAGARDQKQRRVTRWEAALLRRLGLDPDGVAWLHPLLMYNRLRYFFAGRATEPALDRWCAYAPLPTPPGRPAGLPDSYVAVRLYAGGAFAAAPEHRAAAERLIRDVAAHTPVVLLGPGRSLDDHADVPFAAIPGVTTLPAPPLRDNLAVQAAAVARADALVATYGGFAYLGPFLGTPTLALHDGGFAFPAHLRAMRHAERSLRARLEVADATEDLAARLAAL